MKFLPRDSLLGICVSLCECMREKERGGDLLKYFGGGRP